MAAVRVVLYNGLASEGGGELSPWDPIELVLKSVNYKVVYSSARRQNSIAKSYNIIQRQASACGERDWVGMDRETVLLR